MLILDLIHIQKLVERQKVSTLEGLKGIEGWESTHLNLKLK